MIVSCTSELQLKMGNYPKKINDENKLFNWHADIRSVGRKKIIVMVNDLSKYNVLLYGIKDMDFMQIKKIMLNAIEYVMKSDNIDKNLVDKYINKSGEIVFSDLGNIDMARDLEKACLAAELFSDLYEDGMIPQQLASRNLNGFMLIEKGEEYKTPYEIFSNDLKGIV